MKLSLDALKERAEAVASEELLSSISGGVENACHDNVSTISIVTNTAIEMVKSTFLILFVF